MFVVAATMQFRFANGQIHMTTHADAARPTY
jgi:hypothetical protein